MQKPRKNSKSKDHRKSIEGRFEIWKEVNINELYEERKAIQNRLKLDVSPNYIEKLLKRFKLQIQKRNVLMVLINNMSGGILPQIDETLQSLEVH